MKACPIRCNSGYVVDRTDSDNPVNTKFPCVFCNMGQNPDDYNLTITRVGFWGDGVPETGGMVVGWSSMAVGFGELTFYYDKTTKELTCQSECMSEDFVRLVMYKFLKKFKIER